MSVEKAAQTVRQPNLLVSTWTIAAPFWRRRKGIWLPSLLMALAVVATAAQAYNSLVLNAWAGGWLQALQMRDQTLAESLIGRFFLIGAATAALPATAALLSTLVGIEWRTEMTRRLVQGWAGSKVLVWIEQNQILDNPDQRISEDTQLFTTTIMLLILGGVLAIVHIVTYSHLIWTMGADLPLSIAGTRVAVPGGIYWVAVLYALLFTTVTHLVGHALLRLTIEQQQKEANFRFKAATIREYAEQVVLMGGEQAEVRALERRFADIRSILIRVALLNFRLSPTINFLGFVAGWFPTFLLLYNYFGHRIGLGDLIQINGAIAGLAVALSWIPTSYAQLQTLRAVVTRLGELNTAIHVACDGQGPNRFLAAGNDLQISDLNLWTPGGRALTGDVSIHIDGGERWMVHGASGIGKSTLLRAIAGIWSHGTGTIQLPSGKMMMLPQKVYVPAGTLRAALCYPDESDQIADARCREVLGQVELARYVHDLDQSAPWQHRMSPGEQQRLNFARVLLQRPDILLLDEATSALDAANEAGMFAVLRDSLPELTLISVTHNEKLASEHDRQFDLSAFAIGKDDPEHDKP